MAPGKKRKPTATEVVKEIKQIQTLSKHHSISEILFYDTEQ